MTDPHPGDDLLLALALDDVAGPEREQTLRHLATCHRCRTEYDAMSATVERTLPAALSVEPSPGFDARVLSAMGFDPATGTPAAEPRAPHRMRRRWPLVAASVAAGVVLGAGGGYVVSQLDDPAPATVAQHSAFLKTAEGEQVGMVTRSVMNGEPVLVVTVTSGRVGMSYQCRLRLENGKEVATADWVLEDEQGETWLVTPPATKVDELVLVANGGAGPVWSTARL